MSLTLSKNGDVTVSKNRHSCVVEAAWEIEALAYTLPNVTTNGDTEAYQAGLVVRGIASRETAMQAAPA